MQVFYEIVANISSYASPIEITPQLCGIIPQPVVSILRVRTKSNISEGARNIDTS
jgi:hypothetical protein